MNRKRNVSVVSNSIPPLNLDDMPPPEPGDDDDDDDDDDEE